MSTHSETGNVNYPPPPPKDKSSDATKAALCAIVPGVGAVYNQDYMKAVVHLAAFASLCIFAEASGIFGLLAFVFYVFTIFDAYRSAQDPRKKREFNPNQINMPVWGIILILLGTIFLLDSLDAISLRSITKFWPLTLVFLGCYMVFQYFFTRDGRRSSQAGRPDPGFRRYETPSDLGERPGGYPVSNPPEVNESPGDKEEQE